MSGSPGHGGAGGGDDRRREDSGPATGHGGPGAARRPNRLVDSTSPYLLQHAYNPVDWRPWGAEAIAAARREDKPILLSVGYAACHWCHVMERESFEDTGIAALMNEHFICIKVDREERPDVDEIYMGAVQLLTGAGGWPMTVFLTPDLEPFWGGTYFPPDERWGRSGMRQIVPAVARIYHEQRAEVTAQAAEITRAVRGLTSGSGAAAPGDGGPGAAVLDTAVARLLQNHDDEWGGFGPAPKFPPGMAISLLLRVNARAPRRGVVEAVRTTLARMALGGMFDHLGGGFARYSTDEKWHVPHFEKMLYDNALLVSAYAEALRAIGDDDGLYRRTIEETLDFVQRELTDPAGGFYSSLDADSEGEEGRYYVWTPDQLAAVLGPDDAEFLGALYDVTPEGNWEHGNSVLWRTRPLTADERLRAAPLRARLLSARGGRVRPGLDDKVLAGWNGLMISAFVHAATALDRPEWLEPAVAAADFVLRELRRDGRLLRSWRQGRADHNAFLEDHAAMVLALADLYQATFEPRWRRSAGELLEQAVALYGDRAGGFYFTSHDHEELITRPKNAHDGATPAGNSLMAEALLTMSAIEERDDWRALAEQTVLAFGRSLNEIPSAHHRLLRTVDGLVNGTVEIVLAGAAADGPLARAARSRYLPNVVIAAGREMVDGRPAAYVCRNRVCGRPITAPEALAAELSGTTAPRS